MSEQLHPAEAFAIERWNRDMRGMISWETAIKAGVAISRLKQACLDLGYPDPTKPEQEERDDQAIAG